jgi:primase-polymerase (primpol)-like protein
LHIIVKGKVPQGRKRSFIEIYSSGRYATFTGNVYNPNPIADRTDLLKQLWDQMGSGGPATLLFKGDDQEKHDDETIIEQASNAINGDKFEQLLSGRWQDIYPSQSEADLAFINIVSFYTQNRKQIERIFYASPLGQRDKAKRKDYVLWMINKSFDRMLPD